MIKKLLYTVLIFFLGIFISNAQNGEVSGGSPSPGLLITTTSTSATTNVPIVDDNTDFGTVVAGTVLEHDFYFTSKVATSVSVILEALEGQDPASFDTSAPVPATLENVDEISTFKIVFTPDAAATAGSILKAIVHLKVGTGPFGPYDHYYYNVQGVVGAAAPSIEVIDDNSATITIGSTSPFGNAVRGVETITRQYTIKNDGTAPLTIQSIIEVGNPEFSVLPITLPGGGSLPHDIPVGSSLSFDVEFAPDAGSTPKHYSGYIVIDTQTVTANADFPDEDTDFYFIVEGDGIPPTPDMKVYGNSTLIVSGDNTPDVADDTDFGSVDFNYGTVQHTFTIKNEGTADLNLTSLSPVVSITGAGATEFTVIADPSSPITPGNQTEFTIEFDPSALGTFNATIEISNNGVDDPYTFDIQGEGIDVSVTSPLLITQYYEGVGEDDNWIEVKNISSENVTAGSYYLVQYGNHHSQYNYISTHSPDFSQQIFLLHPGEVHLYKRNDLSSIPSAGNRGDADVTTTEVCSFDGDDVIMISGSKEDNCYSDLIDIMGVVPPGDNDTPPFWGQDISYLKGCGTNEIPTKEFVLATLPDGGGLTAGDYRRASLDEVNNASPNTNMALGAQELGKTTWTGSWDKLFPDRTRDVEIVGAYDGSTGSITACNLTVSNTLDFDSGTTNYVDVHGDLTISGGSLTIGDTESLVFGIDNRNQDAVITGDITKKETTTSLTNRDDYTYWSSPIEGASVNTVFSANNLDRVFYWDQGKLNTTPGGSNGSVYGEWVHARNSTITPGKGLISQGPTAGAYPQSQTISFVGIPNNGQVLLKDLVFKNEDGSQDDGYNLVGNPYPSAIDADLFIDANVTLSGTIWFWTHSTPFDNTQPINEKYNSDDYVMYNKVGGTTPGVTNNIGSSQGFMVRATELNGLSYAVFNNSMRLKDQNNQFFRGSDTKKSVSSLKRDRIWLEMQSNEGALSQILIGFMENATDDFDKGYDGLRNSAGYVSLYSKIDTVKYGIQGLSPFSIDKKVSLGFDTYINEIQTYKISISKTEGALEDNEVYLVDNELNITHDLKLTPYEFTMDSTGEFPNRFTLQFVKSTLGVDDFDLKNDFVIINNDDALRIKSSTTVSKIQIFDIMGRLLIESKPNQNEFDIDSKSIRRGTVLILNATFENGAKISKKAIRY